MAETRKEELFGTLADVFAKYKAVREERPIEELRGQKSYQTLKARLGEVLNDYLYEALFRGFENVLINKDDPKTVRTQAILDETECGKKVGQAVFKHVDLDEALETIRAVRERIENEVFGLTGVEEEFFALCQELIESTIEKGGNVSYEEVSKQHRDVYFAALRQYLRKYANNVKNVPEKDLNGRYKEAFTKLKHDLALILEAYAKKEMLFGIDWYVAIDNRTIKQVNESVQEMDLARQISRAAFLDFDADEVKIIANKAREKIYDEIILPRRDEIRTVVGKIKDNYKTGCAA